MLGNTNVQVFGTKKSQATNKALRFFKERAVELHFVDLAVRRPSRGELLRFAQKYGVEALIDEGSRTYRDSGLEVMRFSDENLLDLLIDTPGLLIQPLVRSGRELAIGWQETRWREWFDQVRAS
jgi:arsenate reductase-like glutaredoxin family protein